MVLEIGELLIGVISVFGIKSQITNVIPPEIILNTNSFSVTFFKVCERIFHIFLYLKIKDLKTIMT